MLLTTYTTRDGNIVTHFENRIACVLAGVNLLAIGGFMASQGGLIALDIIKIPDQTIAKSNGSENWLTQESGTMVRITMDDIHKSITAYINPTITESLGKGILEILYSNLEYLKAAKYSEGYHFDLASRPRVENAIAC